MKWRLNHLSSSLKMNWPFGTPSCGHCSEGVFHTYCIIFAPVPMTMQVQHYGNSIAGKPKWVKLSLYHFPSAQDFLLLGCPCWCACPLPCTNALWSILQNVAVGTVRRALTVLPCRTLKHLLGLYDNPFRNQDGMAQNRDIWQVQQNGSTADSPVGELGQQAISADVCP